MVLFGTKGGANELGRGVFYCPQCTSDQRYVHIEIVRKGHLYFVPLVNLGSVGEYVECQHCGGQFDVSVLTLPTRDSLESSLNAAIRGAIAAMIRADLKIDDRETDLGRRLVKELTGEDLSPSQQKLDIRRGLADTPERLFDEISDHLSEQGKVQILEACVLVAAADGQIEEREAEMLAGFAVDLGIPKAYVPSIIESVLQDG
jgi:uncharacterized tellurite resistance protein B-like protein